MHGDSGDWVCRSPSSFPPALHLTLQPQLSTSPPSPLLTKEGKKLEHQDLGVEPVAAAGAVHYCLWTEVRCGSSPAPPCLPRVPFPFKSSQRMLKSSLAIWVKRNCILEDKKMFFWPQNNSCWLEKFLENSNLYRWIKSLVITPHKTNHHKYSCVVLLGMFFCASLNNILRSYLSR